MRDNILKDVYAQDKVELSAMDVELALFDDIKTNIVNARKLKENIVTNLKDANGGLRYCDEFEKSFNKALLLAKEVGLDIPQDVLKFQEMNQELRVFFTKIKAIS